MERRINLGLEENLEAPSSPPRPPEAHEASKSDLFWRERLEQALVRRREVEMPSNRRESLDPDSTLNMSNSVESNPRLHEMPNNGEDRPRTLSGEGSQKVRVYPAESTEEQERLLPPATQLEHHVAGLSLTQIDSSMLSNSTMMEGKDEEEEEEEDYLNDTIVDEVVASQMNVSVQVLDEDDEELIDLLGDLAADVGENQSQPPRTTPTTTEPSTPSQTFSAPSQATPRSSIRPTTPSSRSQRKASQMDEDDEETLEMSQVVWDVDPRTTEETEAALLDATEEEDDDWGALDRTMMEELAKGWEETSTEAVRRFQGDAEEDDQSQSLLDDMEDMFA